MYSFYRWENWGSGKVSNIPKVKQLVSGRAGRKQSLFESLEALDWKWSWGISPFKGGGNGFIIRSKFFTGYPAPISNHTPNHGKWPQYPENLSPQSPTLFAQKDVPYINHSLTSFGSLPQNQRTLPWSSHLNSSLYCALSHSLNSVSVVFPAPTTSWHIYVQLTLEQFRS